MPNQPAVVPGSSAARAGVKETDIIVELNGRKIDPKTGIEEILEDIAIGATLPLKVLRNNKEQLLTLTAEERKP